MNAPHRLFVITRRVAYLAGPLMGLGLTACAGGNPMALGPVDPRSPIAGEVAALAHQNKAFPTFGSIPPEPKDLRPIKAWGQSALQIEAAGHKLERETADNSWTLTGTEAFAGAALRQVGPAASATESSTAATEAYVREMRKRATPPPPPKR
jgi:hypothetical protein